MDSPLKSQFFVIFLNLRQLLYSQFYKLTELFYKLRWYNIRNFTQFLQLLQISQIIESLFKGKRNFDLFFLWSH